MTRQVYRRRHPKSYINPVKADAGESFILKKCIVYFQNHIKKYGVNNNEAIEFAGWVLDDMKAQFLKYIIGFADKTDQEYYEKEFSESIFNSYNSVATEIDK